MQEINSHITIPKHVESRDDLDYSFLREKGIEYIEQLASDLWTDYNSHDPGITILEMLAYAITDLGARIEMPIQNILTPDNSTSTSYKEQFYDAREILPSNPVTATDYRKLFIDIKGVKNCWLSPYRKTVYFDSMNNTLSYNRDDFKNSDSSFISEFTLKGLYSILVDFDNLNPDGLLNESEINTIKEGIYDKIAEKFHENRNLCEDLVKITEVETHPIAICASIEIYPYIDEELVHAKVVHAIDNYLSPSVMFYSFRQMVEKGYSTDQIIDGPLLENGFIDNKELKEAELRTEVRLSDIINIIMNIEGVKVIKDIIIKDCNKIDDKGESWVICVDNNKKPVSCSHSAYSYYKGVLPVNLNKAMVRKYKSELEKEDIGLQEQARYDLEPRIPNGKYFDIGNTTTIQNDFPDTYGIGQNGLPESVSEGRKVMAKQLKGYLLFFDQILASYFAHLRNVKDYLTVKRTEKVGNTEDSPTYFTQVVKDIKDFDLLVNDYPDKDDLLTESLFEKLDKKTERKNQILDHLIARFAERFSDYTFLMKQLYGSESSKITLHTKEAFISNYDKTGLERGSAFNYYRQPEDNLWNSENVSGAEKRIARLTGIKDLRRRDLSKTPVELYKFSDSDGKTVYRWRIRDQVKKIVLTATENYHNTIMAENELAKTVLKVIETNKEIIKRGFEDISIEDETIIGNFQVQQSSMGNYSFNVIDTEANPNSSKWVIARHYIYYGSLDKLKKAMLSLVDFMTNIFSEEGMFLVEHILLRPDVTSEKVPLKQFMTVCDNKKGECTPADPYSFRVTIILPGWTYRFSNKIYREYLENLIREELPAHVLARICWIGYRENYPTSNENDMVMFERALHEYLLFKTDSGQAQNEDRLIDLIENMNRLNSIYPSGRLFDCDNENEDSDGMIVLGRTNIGNIK